MAIIKSNATDHTMRTAVALRLDDLVGESRAVLERAQAAAAELIEQARAEARQLVETAREAARQEGMEQGLAEGEAAGREQAVRETIEEFRPQVEALMEGWSAVLDGWDRQRRALYASAEEDLLDFAVEVSRKVVLRVVEADRTVIADQLAEALGHLAGRTTAEVAVHPDDRALAERVLPDLLERIGRCDHAELRDDTTLQRGGCVVRTPQGRIDASIETQLERIAAAFRPAGSRDGAAGADSGGSGSAGGDVP